MPEILLSLSKAVRYNPKIRWPLIVMGVLMFLSLVEIISNGVKFLNDKKTVNMQVAICSVIILQLFTIFAIVRRDKFCLKFVLCSTIFGIILAANTTAKDAIILTGREVFTSTFEKILTPIPSYDAVLFDEIFISNLDPSYYETNVHRFVSGLVAVLVGSLKSYLLHRMINYFKDQETMGDVPLEVCQERLI